MFNITVFRQHFVINAHTFFARNILDIFIKKFNTYELKYDYKTKRFTKKIGKVYAGMNPHLHEYRIPITVLNSFIKFLEQHSITEDKIYLEYIPMHEIDKVNIKINPKFKPRDDQPRFIDYLTTLDERHTKLLNLDPGKGKGFISLYSISKIGMKTMIVILPKYIEKWIIEIKEKTDTKDNEILVIKGGKSLEDLFQMSNEQLSKIKFIIFSNRTVANYIKEYENVTDINDFSYSKLPQEVTSFLKVGILLIDEVHQEFYTNYKVAMYFNVELLIGLSATLYTRDKKLEIMYKLLFPDRNRIDASELDKYIDVYAVKYYFKNPKRIRYKSQGNGYSQVMFEKSILRNSDILENYLKMIDIYVKLGYIQYREKGDKLVIYAGTIRMCNVITEYLSEIYPDLDIRRYVEDDPFENVIEPDIRVTTQLSAGVAIDIPGLITTIMTINVLSVQANIQNLGRLRYKKNKQMRYYFTYAGNIDKHKEYTKERLQMFRKKAKNIFFEIYPDEI